jgi:predicted CXXCH cytochrome family protein
MNKTRATLIFICLFCLPIAILLDSCGLFQTKQNLSNADNKYVGPENCVSCHVQQNQDWKQSDHFKAMQLPTDSSVLGNFATEFTADGVQTKLIKKDGKFYINTQGDDGKNHDYLVKYTFGYFPLQQYLIEFPGGKLQASRASWDSRKNKWFNQYPNQKIHHKDWLHWTGNGQNWNTMCASCHSTNFKKNYSFANDTYASTFDHINVSCESCHGPGANHISYIESNEFKAGKKTPHSYLLATSDTNNLLQIASCAPCHARSSVINPEPNTSQEIMNQLIPEPISDENYYADGQIKNEDYELGSYMQSKMFHNNVRCTNCHNPHSGKLIKAGNALCLNCHAPKYNSTTHHFHKIETEASQCINCHMTAKTYMGNDIRRDHSFRIPRPDQSVKYATPNACTNCHTNQNNTWAANKINTWYGPKRRPHFSDDLLPGSLMNQASEAHLVRLLKDTSNPAIARATAAYYLRNISTEQTANALLYALSDKQAQVRYQSLKSLENFPPNIWQEAAKPCLSDPIKAVRIAAADLYHLTPKAIPTDAKKAYETANAENLNFLESQSDFATGSSMLGDYHLQSGDAQNAILYYQRSLQKDSLLNYPRFNMATIYNSMGRNKEAIQMLKDVASIYPTNARTYYNLGLLYYEEKNIQEAIKSFDKSLKLGNTQAEIYYNYGLLLQQMGKEKEAEKLLTTGFQLHPNAANLNYALAYYYIQKGNIERASKHINLLKQLDPNNPKYAQLFSFR